MSLDINKSYKAILAAARAGRFITYGAVAAASDVEWKKARRPLPQQLDDLVRISHERNWPLITAIVVNQGERCHRKTGRGCPVRIPRSGKEDRRSRRQCAGLPRSPAEGCLRLGKDST